MVFAVLAVGGLVAGVIGYKMESRPAGGETPIFEAAETRYDFGDIEIAGGLVRHNFKIANAGAGELKLSNIKTSCMCTSAVLRAGNEESPEFGMHNNSTFWSQKLGAGESAELEVIFDPMAHGPDAIGPITRTVSILANDSGQNVQKIFTFTANVIK